MDDIIDNRLICISHADRIKKRSTCDEKLAFRSHAVLIQDSVIETVSTQNHAKYDKLESFMYHVIWQSSTELRIK